MRIALIQLSAGPNKEENLEKAVSFVKSAAQKGAKFILLPEIFIFRGELSENKKNVVEKIPGPTTKKLAQLAKMYGVYILAGSIFEQATSKKAYNTSVLISPSGKILSQYRKINLFNACIGKNVICEADHFMSGQKSASTRVEGFQVGLSICFDLRFPELYRAYFKKGVQIITVPSAFTQKTGEAHWEILLRARAIENQAFVLAPNQVGEDHRGVKTYGNSMVVDPWGRILARGSGDREEIIFADISLDHIHDVQKILPLTRRRV